MTDSNVETISCSPPALWGQPFDLNMKSSKVGGVYVAQLTAPNEIRLVSPDHSNYTRNPKAKQATVAKCANCKLSAAENDCKTALRPVRQLPNLVICDKCARGKVINPNLLASIWRANGWHSTLNPKGGRRQGLRQGQRQRLQRQNSRRQRQQRWRHGQGQRQKQRRRQRQRRKASRDRSQYTANIVEQKRQDKVSYANVCEGEDC